MNRDPLGEEGGENLYLFCLNRTPTVVDPTGLKGGCCCCCAEDVRLEDRIYEHPFTHNQGVVGLTFFVDITLSYEDRSGIKSDCELEWWEYSNKAIIGRGGEVKRLPFVSKNMIGESAMFDFWKHREMCQDHVRIQDNPGTLPHYMGKDRKHDVTTLWIDVIVKSGKDCWCTLPERKLSLFVAILVENGQWGDVYIREGYGGQPKRPARGVEVPPERVPPKPPTAPRPPESIIIFR